MALEREGREPVKPLIDVKQTIEKVLLGDEDAQTLLYNELSSRVRGFLRSRLRNHFDEVEDLTQETVVTVFSNLQDFTPDDPTKIESRFTNWVFTIARSCFYHTALRDSRLQTESIGERDIPEQERYQPPAPAEIEERTDTLKRRLQNEMAEMLPPHQMKIAQLSLEGKSTREIAELIGRTFNGVAGELSQIRKKIEERYLTPAGYKRIGSYHDRGIEVAATDKRVEAVSFFHIRYITDEEIVRYAARRQKVDNTILQNGYVLLSDCTTAAEYATLQANPSYRDVIVRSQRRIYIKPEDLETFKKTRTKLRPKRLRSPITPNFIPISKLGNTYQESTRLQRGVMEGKLKAIKHKNKWYTTQEDYETFLHRSELIAIFIAPE